MAIESLAAILGGAGGLLGGVAGIAGLSGSGGEGSLRDVLKLLRKVQEPNFDFRNIDPEELTLVAEYFPNVYEAIVADDVKLAADSPEMRSAQARGVAHLERIASEGLPLGERLAAQQAGRDLAREASRVDAGILRDLRERGRAGGGTELLARSAAGQHAAERAAEFGTGVAREAVMNRLRGAVESGRAAGALRGQDISLRLANAQAANRYNEFVSALMTQAARDAAQARERAHFANVGRRQDVADYNVRNRQATSERNLDRRNTLQQWLGDFRLRKAGAQAGALSDLARGQYAEQSARQGNLYNIGVGGGQFLGGLLDRYRGGSRGVQLPQPNRYQPNRYDWEDDPYAWRPGVMPVY